MDQAELSIHRHCSDGAPEAIETKDPWDDDAIELREQVVVHASRSARDGARGDGAKALVGLTLFVMIFGAWFVAGI